MSAHEFKYRLPEVLEAHRQTANWLVGLSAGALAGFATFLDKPRVHGSLEEWLLALAALFFLLAICAGVAFHLAITVFTNNFEQCARAEESIEEKNGALQKARDANNATSVASIEQSIKDLSDKAKDCKDYQKTWQRWYKRFYRMLTVCFYGSLVLGGWYIAVSATGGDQQTNRGDVLLLDGRNQTDTCKGYSALLLDTKSGRVFELHNDEATGGTRWDLTAAFAKKVCADSVQVIGGQMPPQKQTNVADPDSSQMEAKRDQAETP
ncbi:MAG: hypothetical protein H6592_06205 [Flavobacteriales bacterium]|nr:hypothetical protein [Flavobacteriales bacterium]